MSIGKIILLGILAGIYSGILNELEGNYGINRFTSILLLSLLIVISGYILNKVGSKKVD